MQFKRKFFEYGILFMGIACLFILGLLFVDLIYFVVNRILTFDVQVVFNVINGLIQRGNYIELILILIWGLFFIGVFLVSLSLVIHLIFGLFFRSNVLKDPPENIEINPDDIAIVIPAYNEEETIEQIILECQKYANHIVVIDDGSTDKTPEILLKFTEIHVLTNRTNKGLGLTMKKGVEFAANLDVKVIITFDADGQYRTTEIPKIAAPVLLNQTDLVLGSRFAGKIEEMSLNKKLGNKLMSFALSLLLGTRVTDSQTGFRGISKELALLYRLRGEYTYTQEMILQARFLKKEIIEIPIFFDKRLSGPSRLIRSPVDYALKSWLTIIRTLRDFQPIWFFGGFGVVSFLLGLFIFSISVVSIIVPWAFSIHFPDPLDLSIFSVILMMIGAQFVFFGLLADAQKH